MSIHPMSDLDLVRNPTGHATFDYWGFSYGTALGSMYAAMFPDNVGKMVIDGISIFGIRNLTLWGVALFRYPREISNFLEI
jgi:pimeloyl-ACP methyl ester carboxylesterase